MDEKVYQFYVNGKLESTAEDKPLIRFLRDDLMLYSVKDGCSEGACGACMIDVNGVATRACVLTTRLANGKHIITVEGLSVREKEAFVYAFGLRGAVQCGFCIPGMVMSGKALIDRNSCPDEEDIKYALRGNVCRCTGYRKIIEGIQLAAAVLSGNEQIDNRFEKGDDYGVGKRAFRVDVRRKTLGYGKYPDDIGPEYFVREGSARALEIARHLAESQRAGDIAVANTRMGANGTASTYERRLKAGMTVRRIDDPGCNWCVIVDKDMPPMAYMSAVRSKYARAKVLSIDSSRAEALPGVIGVLTAADVPNNKVGHLRRDWDVMIAVGDTTRMVGDTICCVVAESRSILKKAKELVKVRYEVLEPVHNVFEAMRPDAPLIHPGGNLCESRHIVRGDPEGALQRSKYTYTQHFSTPFTEHAFLEPECAVSFPYKNGVKILSTDQGAYATRHECASMFGWPEERVVVENQLIGGGFGGKEDVTTQHISALAAWKYKRPIKAKFERQESLNFHPKRHAMDGTFTLGCDENGILQALDCEFYFDTGAYASLCGPVVERACTHAVGPYRYQNTDIRGYGYYTNNPPGGAFRGFGVCQTQFAVEAMLNVLAEKVGISPWEIRYRNAISPGKVLPNGQIADVSTSLKEALEAVKPYYEVNRGHAGIACAMKNAGTGVGIPDNGQARLVIENGMVVIFTCASDIGQGALTVFTQDVSEATGLPRSRILVGVANTENAPDSGTTSGSRQSTVTGEAVRGAAFLLRDAMLAAQMSEEMGDNIVDILKKTPAYMRPRVAPNTAASYGTGLEYAPGTEDSPFVSPNMTIGDDGLISGEGTGLNQGTYGEHGTQTHIRGCPVRDYSAVLDMLEGMSFYYCYHEPTDRLGSNVPNPKSHVAYGFAACCVILDKDGKVTDVYSAYDAGKVINPISIQGQIEGGVLMGLGYALTEVWPLKECRPDVKYGSLGLLRATQIPDIHAMYVEKKELLGVAYGGKGIGEITTIPAAPAVQGAYYELDHKFRNSLPMDDTYYSRRK